MHTLIRCCSLWHINGVIVWFIFSGLILFWYSAAGSSFCDSVISFLIERWTGQYLLRLQLLLVIYCKDGTMLPLQVIFLSKSTISFAKFVYKSTYKFAEKGDGTALLIFVFDPDPSLCFHGLICVLTISILSMRL